MNKVIKNALLFFGLCLMSSQMMMAASNEVTTHLKIVNNTKYYLWVKDLLQTKLYSDDAKSHTWDFKEIDLAVIKPMSESTDISFSDGWSSGSVEKYTGKGKTDTRTFTSYAELLFTKTNEESKGMQMFRGVGIQLSPGTWEVKQAIAVGVDGNQLIEIDVTVKVTGKLNKTINFEAGPDFAIETSYYDYTVVVSASEEAKRDL